MKKLTAFCLSLLIVFQFSPAAVQGNTKAFSDVPKSHWSYEYVAKVKELGITQGIGENKFGLGQDIKRAEFVSFLCKLLEFQSHTPAQGSFEDNKNTNTWYFSAVETALKNGIVTSAQNFRPLEPITREEMAVMIVRALGLDELANLLDARPSGFKDVLSNKGYINIAKDLGIIAGVDEANFSPKTHATREQAAAMMIRMYGIKNNTIQELNGFYAIKSASQQNVVSYMDYVSFGWARLEIADSSLILNTSSQNNNEYRLPDGYEVPLSTAKNKMLMIAVKDNESALIINNSQLRANAVTLISDAVNNGIEKNGDKVHFDGVVIDFETLKGGESKANLNNFLKELRGAVGTKKIFTAVHPQTYSGSYYDGYDYKTIGELSDKVILMAHDYNAKSLSQNEMDSNMSTTPMAPIDEIYYALKAITDKNTGVADRSKIMLQLSFGTCQWKIQNNKVINEKPYTPDYAALANRIKSDSSTEIKYSKTYESPYITFYNSDDSTQNIVWYEDSRSIEAKINLAKLFNISGISIWRLGTIPDYEQNYYLDVVEKVLNP